MGLHNKINCEKCGRLLGFQHGDTWPDPSPCNDLCPAVQQIAKMMDDFDPGTRELTAPPGSYGPYKDDTSPGWDNMIRGIEG